MRRGGSIRCRNSGWWNEVGVAPPGKTKGSRGETRGPSGRGVIRRLRVDAADQDRARQQRPQGQGDHVAEFHEVSPYGGPGPGVVPARGESEGRPAGGRAVGGHYSRTVRVSPGARRNGPGRTSCLARWRSEAVLSRPRYSLRGTGSREEVKANNAPRPVPKVKSS